MNSMAKGNKRSSDHSKRPQTTPCTKPTALWRSAGFPLAQSSNT